MPITTRGAPLVKRTRTGLWLGDDASGRPIAIRQALPGVAASEDVRKELAREARVLVALGPQEAVLALLVDASCEDPPRLLLEGGELRTLASFFDDHRPFELPAALGVLLPLAELLDAAHGASIVHGAIGPEVVLLTPRGTPKLASWADAEVPALTPLPSSDELRDLDWLAPEVIMGERPGPSADVFALGALLGLMLCGRPLLEGPEGGSEAPRTGRSASPRIVQEALTDRAPESVRRVIARAIARSPAERFENAGELLKALGEASAAPGDRRAVRSALARRGFGSAPPLAASPEPRPHRGGVSPWPFVAVLAGLAGWAGAVELLSDAPPDVTTSAGSTQQGYLRILAHPWASVALDGEPLDTTPIGAPVAVRPGRHVLDFVHPKAAKVQRVVEVVPGQTVVVDVILDLPQPVEVDAGPVSP